MAQRRFFDGAQAEIGSTQADLGGFVSPTPVAATSSIPQPTGWYLTVTDTFTVNDIYDDAGWDSVNGLRLTDNFMSVGDHLGSNDGYGSWRFNIPSGINVDSISDVRMRPMAKQTGSVAGIFRVEQSSAAAFNYDFAQRPDQRWGAVGSTDEQPTGPVAGTADTRFSATDFPNLAPRVRTALNGMGGSGYLGIHLGGAGNTGNYVWQMWAYDSTGGWTKSPQLQITHVIVVQPYVQPTAPAATTTIPGPLLYERKENVSYDNGLAGYSDRRVVDIYLPMGTAPAGGWPVAMFVHGGGFAAGDEDDIQGTQGYRYRHDTIGNGFAVTSVSYKLSDLNIITNISAKWTRPHPQQDMLAFLKWLGTQSTYDLDHTKIIGTAYSAGGHLMLEAACFLEDPDIDTYLASNSGQAPGANPGVSDLTGTGPLGDRYNDYPTLDITQGRTNIPRPIGVFTFGGPVSLTKIWADSLILDGIINVYFGIRPNGGPGNNAVNEEGDIDAFLTGLVGSIYAPRGSYIRPSFPIGLMYTVNDTTVPVSAGYTPLINALTTVGYNVADLTDKQINHGVTVSRYSYTGTGDSAGGHDTLMAQYDRPFFVEWLKNTLALTLADTVAVTSTVPTPAWSEVGGGTGETTAPDVVAATSTVPSAGWGTDQAPAVIAATSTIPAPTWGTDQTPAVVTGTSTVPAPGWRSAPTLATVTATVTIPSAGWVQSTTVAAVAAVAATPSVSWGAGWVPSVVAAVTAIAAQGGVGGGYTTPAAVVSSSTAPASVWGAGWVLASVTSTTTVPAPSALGGGAGQVAVVTGTSTTPAPVWGAGWLLTGPAATTTVPAASFAAGGTATPTTIAVTSTTPGPTWGAGWIATQVAALAAVPTTTWVSRSTVSTVATTSTIPAPGWVGRSTVATVATTTTISSITWGAGWVLTGPSTTTSIAAQGGVGGGYTTPATVGASATITTTTWGAGWVLTGPTATTSIGSPDFAGGATAYPTTVSATTTVPGPVWGAGWVLSRVQSSTSIPSATWVTRTSVTAVATTASISSIAWGAGWLLVGPTALVAISAQGGVSGGLTTPSSVSGASAIPSPAWGSGNQLGVTAGAAGIPSFVWSSGLTADQVAVLVQLESATWGAGWTQEQVEAAAQIEAPATSGGIEMIMAVMATVMIGFATTTRIGQTFSYFDGVNEYECEATYYDRTGPMEVMLEWIE